MVKPRKEGAFPRRVASISFYAAAFLVLITTAPLWIVVVFLIGLARRRRFVLLRLFVFACFYFGFELYTLTRLGFVCLGQRHDPERLQARVVALQTWWASSVLHVARGLLGLRIAIDGVEEGTPGPAILLIRHASMLDTLLPCVVLQRPTNWRVRYIVKQELLIDPCLDIAGHILPNYFIDRTGDTQRELQGVRDLAADLGDDGILIFPEGTRFSPEKRARAVARIGRDNPSLLPAAEAMEGVVPPKPGGVLALLDALPDVDCVFFAHRGLESFARIKDLLSGEVVGSTVHVWIWRIERERIPIDPEERVRWLFDQWDRVSRRVANRTTEL